jgi:prevent-host-death family protein
MATRRHRGVEEARSQLPHLLEQAAAGKATVITRHGKPIAAIMPLDAYGSADRQQSILPLAGSGHGLWGTKSATTMRKFRREWNR